MEATHQAEEAGHEEALAETPYTFIPPAAPLAETNRVLVTNLSDQANDKVLNDFFSFCGKITALEINRDPTSEETLRAIVTFESTTEASTALLLTNAMLVDRAISIVPYTGEQSKEPLGSAAADEQDSSKSSIVSSVLADSVIFGQTIFNSAKQLNQNLHISETVKEKALDPLKAGARALDDQFHVKDKINSFSEKAKEMDEKYKLKETTKAVAATATQAASDLAKQALGNPAVQRGYSWLKAGWTAAVSTAKSVREDTMHKVEERKVEAQLSEERESKQESSESPKRPEEPNILENFIPAEGSLL